MATTAKIEVNNQDLLEALKGFLQSLLQQEAIQALLVPQRLPMKPMVMPTLVTDPQQLEGADPLSPAFALNAAKLVSRLTRKPAGGKVAVVLRPCEIRAFVELVKLKQGRREDVLIVGVDCLGAYRNTDYLRFAGDDAAAATRRFYQSRLAGEATTDEDIPLAAACQACEFFVPRGADLTIGLFGVDTAKELLVQADTDEGAQLLDRLELKKMQVPAGRKETIAKLAAERIARRDAMFAATREATDNLEKLTAYLAGCVNCYNCRVACPVCYCKECVFVTDVFNHEPAQYLRWASRKGAVKMPTDTVFYHLTRLVHMSTACVGCGQCSNACPNEIPVMELFRTVAQRSQAAFDYEAGRSVDEAPPLAEFREQEFEEVVGIGS